MQIWNNWVAQRQQLNIIVIVSGFRLQSRNSRSFSLSFQPKTKVYFRFSHAMFIPFLVDLSLEYSISPLSFNFLQKSINKTVVGSTLWHFQAEIRILAFSSPTREFIWAPRPIPPTHQKWTV